ncbi:MAG TPA: OmpH family outer membrane protein [Thermoanaerobaculia bacterium]|nr:OmpH family outer membrane protein [Thermoanaerobaculia bacterium]
MPLCARFSKTVTATAAGVALAALGLLPVRVAQAAPAAGAGPAGAAATAPAGGGSLRIAVIDTEKILLSSAAGKKAIAELKKAQEAKEAELKFKQQEIKELQDKMTQGRLSLAQDKLTEMQKELEDKEIALRRLSDDATRELNKKKDDLLGGIDEKVMPVINQIGHEQGYTMIFRKFESGLIYADDAIDITPSVIQRLDAAAAAK